MARIAIASIRTDGGTQTRVSIDQAVVDDYADAIQGGTKLPDVTVYHDGLDYWLADGFHRHAAHLKAKRKSINADVRHGSRREAILHACGANSTHGLRRTNADKRNSVLTLLKDPEWSQWSDREVARRCGVSDFMVRNVRRDSICEKIADRKPDNDALRPTPPLPEPSKTDDEQAESRLVQRGGKTYAMDTGNIGRPRPYGYGYGDGYSRPPVKPPPAPEPEPAPEPKADPYEGMPHHKYEEKLPDPPGVYRTGPSEWDVVWVVDTGELTLPEEKAPEYSDDEELLDDDERSYDYPDCNDEDGDEGDEDLPDYPDDEEYSDDEADEEPPAPAPATAPPAKKRPPMWRHRTYLHTEDLLIEPWHRTDEWGERTWSFVIGSGEVVPIVAASVTLAEGDEAWRGEIDILTDSRLPARWRSYVSSLTLPEPQDYPSLHLGARGLDELVEKILEAA